MHSLLVSAGLLSIVVGLVHSALGEFLIFKKLRNNSVVPNVAVPPIRERNIRILWATWHLASILGFAMGAILIQLAEMSVPPAFVVQPIAFSMAMAGALVCYATNGRHPGWAGLLGVAVLCWLA
ncbi:hypothetical protein [Lacimicrobium alkaliphilum]|uniref:Uncharacterized protein n=1 Tax=Lacimicrobium alkaliphilum TaxID=1526571 RepID=A0A0U2PCX6_9ALTE|nr:hypothetical protein [Lacimicrobium alkaliphilum]ALS96877.1 hypothetical protein AT746_00355 [Lacimicrobium alkaliphilum]